MDILFRRVIRPVIWKNLSGSRKEDVEFGQPNSEGLLKIISYFKCTIDDVYYLGDSDGDIISGRDANIKTIKVSYLFK